MLTGRASTVRVDSVSNTIYREWAVLLGPGGSVGAESLSCWAVDVKDGNRVGERTGL